jgi:hypothetical protein
LNGSEFSTVRRNEQDRKAFFQRGIFILLNLVRETWRNHRKHRKDGRYRGQDMNSGLLELEAV